MKVILTSDLHYGCAPNSANKLLKFFKKLGEEVKANDVKLVILAGDLASTRLRQFRKCLELANEHLHCNLAVVRGNHDFWDGSDPKDKQAFNRSLKEIEDYHERVFSEFHIHHLEKGPLVIEDVIFCGWDGWYAKANPPTNDHLWMPKQHQGCPIMPYLSNRAWKRFEDCLAIDTSKYRKKVIVTHFNPYPYGKGYDPKANALEMSANTRFLEEIKGKFDILCCGHTHQWLDHTDHTCDPPLRTLNCGSDYNQPRFFLFEV